MARNRYGWQKRAKEIARKQKNDDKMKRRQGKMPILSAEEMPEAAEPGMDGIEVLQSIKRDYPHIPVIMITGYATVESAVEAMKSRGGARHYIPRR